MYLFFFTKRILHLRHCMWSPSTIKSWRKPVSLLATRSRFLADFLEELSGVEADCPDGCCRESCARPRHLVMTSPTGSRIDFQATRHCLSSIPENVECTRAASWMERDTMDWMISKTLCGLCGASRHVHRLGSTFVVCSVQLTAVPQKHIGVTENQRLRIAGLQTRAAFAHPSRCAAEQPFQCGTARWHGQCSTSHAGQARQERLIAAPELERTSV